MSDTSLSLLDRLSLQPDDKSWTRFAELYVPLIRGWLRHFAVKEQDAEDLSQEVMAVVIRELSGFRHNQKRGAFRHWLRTVTVNQIRLAWRVGHGRPVGTGDSAVEAALTELADPHSSLSRLWDRQHDEHVARRVMALIEPHFEPTTWQAFRSVVLEGKKAAAVAEELGLSVNAVLLAKSRVLSRLRKEIRGLTD